MGDRSSPTTEEYAVRIPASFIDSMRESSVAQPTPLRNLQKEFLEMNDEMQVYVRIKPYTESDSVLSVSGNHIVVQPSKDSTSYKNRNNAGTKTLQKFKFSKIYDSTVDQEALFKDSALYLVQDFLMGKNALLFTYGATCAGKTYTMLGTIRNAGLIPRSLDVLFNSLDGKLLPNAILKPLGLTEVMKLNLNQIDVEETVKAVLMRGFDLDYSDSKDSISSTTSGSIKDWNIRERDTTVGSLQHSDDFFSVWVSYCEIYNEQAFDLLESCDKKKKRAPLRITEDRKGRFYVKGLKEICVQTADEAVRVMLFGKQHLHFAATKLNHNSSRSHCIFTVKMIRTNHPTDPSEAAINMMSFVDLAGLERTTKTQSRGERLKEAGNINTSLLILGRCIDAIRNNQHHSSKIIVPYRESKLTRILQHFFSGQGRAAMFVNVSPSPVLCDETLHVLKFGALAQEVVIQTDRDFSGADMSISQFAPPLRPSRFQQYVRKSISTLSARPSVLEPSFQLVDEEGSDQSDRVRELEEEVARLKVEWDENEQKVRDECCSEWSELFSRMEQTWIQRYEETKARYEEFCENRVDLMSQVVNSCVRKKRKVSAVEDMEQMTMKFKDKDDRIEMLESSNERLTDLVQKLKGSLKISEEGRADLQQQMTRLQFETASSNKAKINFCGFDEHQDLEIDTETIDSQVKKLQAKLASKEDLLKDAVLEYHSKSEELTKCQVDIQNLSSQLAVSNADLANIQTQLERSNLLLSDANDRLDAREEELMVMEEKLMKANAQFGNLNTDLREAKRRIRDLEARIKDQTNASMVSSMCEDLQKQLLETETKLERRNEDLESIRDELCQCKAKIKEQENALDNFESLNDRFAKSQLQLSSSKEQLERLQEENEDLKVRSEGLLDQLSHLKKDLELSNTERKHDEGSHSNLLEDNSKMFHALQEMRASQDKLRQENTEYRKAMSEFESTVEELTEQIGRLRESQRERSLLEEELQTLAATLGRVQYEKNLMEKDSFGQKNEMEQMKNQIQSLKDEKARLLGESQQKEALLNNELDNLKKVFESSSESNNDSLSKVANLEAELLKTKGKLLAMEKTVNERSELENSFQIKFDQLEKENELLTKDMLKHMRRASELSESLHTLNEELKLKSLKCDSLFSRITELETQNSSLSEVQSKLVDQLEKKEASIGEMKLLNERVMNEKNQEIGRLENEIKSILTGHVNYKKPGIKMEDVSENQPPLEEDSDLLLATPTPLRGRRGRGKKISSPGSTLKDIETEDKTEDKPEDKTDANSFCGSTRSRRTIKTDFSAPPSSTKTSGRKPRKNKSDCEDVAHPALVATTVDEGPDSSTPALSSKRRLYNSKCPEILLPNTKREESDGLEFPKRMATRSRKQ